MNHWLREMEMIEEKQREVYKRMAEHPIFPISDRDSMQIESHISMLKYLAKRYRILYDFYLHDIGIIPREWIGR